MRTVTSTQAANDLEAIIRKTIHGHDEIVISSDEGAVVMIDESEWMTIKETLRLLSDKESLAALLESHAARDRGEKPEGISPEEAFKDV